MIQRYALPEMESVWSRESRYSRWLEIEVLAVEARASLGLVPAGDAEAVRRNASFDIRRIDEIEREVRHDVIAFLTSVSESLGPESRHVHYGMTSSDVLDTCLATQLRDAGALVEEALVDYGEALAGLVRRGRGVACMGRSHGMFAEPTTMALKFAGHYSEHLRCLARLRSGLESACVGKVSGAVGTYAGVQPEVEEYVCRRLGIGREPVATQVVARDRHAQLVYALAAAGGMLERFATEVRHLQRSEVGEAEESFGKGQKGSSAMPHKRNPIVAERLSGLARLLRGYLLTALENTALWHERDISHSSAERFLFPDAFGVCLYALRKAAGLASGLVLFPKAIARNLDSAGERYCSGGLMLALTDAGLTREEAYAAVQRVSMEAMDSGEGLLAAAERDPVISGALGEDGLPDSCSIDYHLRYEGEILDRLGLRGARDEEGGRGGG